MNFLDCYKIAVFFTGATSRNATLSLRFTGDSAGLHTLTSFFLLCYLKRDSKVHDRAAACLSVLLFSQ